MTITKRRLIIAPQCDCPTDAIITSSLWLSNWCYYYLLFVIVTKRMLLLPPQLWLSNWCYYYLLFVIVQLMLLLPPLCDCHKEDAIITSSVVIVTKRMLLLPPQLWSITKRMLLITSSLWLSQLMLGITSIFVIVQLMLLSQRGGNNSISWPITKRR